MPRENALTEIVYDSIKNRNYKVFGETDNRDIMKYDVVMYWNIGHDPFFGVCSELDGNVIYLKTGTKDGVITKILEG